MKRLLVQDSILTHCKMYIVKTAPIYQHIMNISLYNAEVANVETEVLLKLWAMVKVWAGGEEKF